MPCSLKGLILLLSWWMLTPLEAYCSHVKRTKYSCPLICDIAIYHLPLPEGVGWGGGDWRCTFYTMSGAVSDIGCIDQSLLFFPQGLEPGTVVITTRAVNALLEPFSEQVL